MFASRLGSADERKPLTLRDWNPLAVRIHESSLKRPGALLGLDQLKLQAELGLSEDEAERLWCLLDRSGSLAIELERLESLGIWTTTRVDSQYPERLRKRLKASAPAVLFGAGDLNLVGTTGLAIVGSRNVDEAGKAAAEFAGQACARFHWTVYSGAARGVDEIAMKACIERGGNAVGLLADSLEKAIRAPFSRQALSDGTLTMLTMYSPKAPFSVGAAMGRNKLIYALADRALIIASDADSGGTWTGASEALKSGHIPVFVRESTDVPAGNKKLIQKGGIAFPDPFSDPIESLPDWMAAHAGGRMQPTLFGDEE